MRPLFRSICLLTDLLSESGLAIVNGITRLYVVVLLEDALLVNGFIRI